MSGHSKWANIKHRKGAQDAKRAKVFSRASKLVILAAQAGGGDIETNYALKTAIEAARKVNMPKDNIDRAIKTALGGEGAARMEQIIYEAMGPGGSSFIISCMTDNTNRTLTDVKTALKKNQGKFVPTGSVTFNYDHVGAIEVSCTNENAELELIESGAKDIETLGDQKFLVLTEVSGFHDVQGKIKAIEDCDIESANLIYKPLQPTELSDADFDAFEQLYDVLDEVDDVDEIFTNVV